MANVQEDDRPSRKEGGFFPVFRDLHRALRVAKLNALERALFDSACEESWLPSFLSGDHEPTPFLLDLTSLARILGSDREDLSKALNRLVARRFFEVESDGRYQIVKDYRLWMNAAGLPLLSPDQIAWCLAIRKRARKHATANPDATGATPRPARVRRQVGQGQPSGSAPLPNLTDLPTRPPEPGPSSGSTGSAVRLDTPSEVAPPRTPIEEAPASEEFRRVNIENTHHIKGNGDGCPPLPDVLLWPIHSGSFRPEESEVIETWRLSNALFPGTRIPEEVWGHQRQASPDVWNAALREAKKRRPNLETVHYVLRLASDFQANGIPKAALPEARAPHQRPSGEVPTAPSPRLAKIKSQTDAWREEAKRRKGASHDGS